MLLSLSPDELRPLVQEVVAESLRQLGSLDCHDTSELHGNCLLVDVPTASKMLSVCPKTLWTLTDQGEIPAIKIGRAVRYSPDDLRAWIEVRRKQVKANESGKQQ